MLGPSYTFVQIKQGKKIYVDSKRVKHSLEIKIFCLSDNFWLNDLVEFAPRQLSQTFIVDGTTAGVFAQMALCSRLDSVLSCLPLQKYRSTGDIFVSDFDFR